jgi:hypothetical protein
MKFQPLKLILNLILLIARGKFSRLTKFYNVVTLCSGLKSFTVSSCIKTQSE